MHLSPLIPAIVLLAGCYGSSYTPDAFDPLSRNWELVEIGYPGMEHPVRVGTSYTLQIAASGQSQGTIDCNTYSTRLLIALEPVDLVQISGAMVIERPRPTELPCPDMSEQALAQNRFVVDSLGEVVSYSVENEELQLTTDGSVVLRFLPKYTRCFNSSFSSNQTPYIGTYVVQFAADENMDQELELWQEYFSDLRVVNRLSSQNAAVLDSSSRTFDIISCEASVDNVTYEELSGPGV